MKRFRSAGGTQRVLSAFSGISPHFRPRRHRLHADAYRREMTFRFATWNDGRVMTVTYELAARIPDVGRHAVCESVDWM